MKKNIFLSNLVIAVITVFWAFSYAETSNPGSEEALRMELNGAKRAESSSLERAMKLYEDILVKYEGDELIPEVLYDLGTLKAKYIIELKKRQTEVMRLSPNIAADTQGTPLIDDYISKYPNEFEMAGYSGWHVVYNGYHFHKIMSDYPTSEFEDDAAYALTKLQGMFDCESSSCYIRFVLPQVQDFLRQYPKSPLAEDAVNRVNTALEQSVGVWVEEMSRRGGQEETIQAGIDIMQELQDYEKLTVDMPKQLRTKALDAIIKAQKSLEDKQPQ